MGAPVAETSYTAWDGNLYEWPPPDGWYEAADGKWWPEGYGPSNGDGESGATPGDTPTGNTENGAATTPTASADTDDDDDDDELPDISDLFGGEDIFADDGEDDGDDAAPAVAATEPAADLSTPTAVAEPTPDPTPEPASSPEPDPVAAPDLGVAQSPPVQSPPVQSPPVEEQLAEVTPIDAGRNEAVAEAPDPVEISAGFGVTPTYDDGPEAFAADPTPERDPAPDPASFGGGLLLNDQSGGYPGGAQSGGGRGDRYDRSPSGYTAGGYDDSANDYGETLVDDGYGGARGQLLDQRDELDDDPRVDEYQQPAAYQDTDDGRTNWPLAVAGACLAALVALLVIYLLTRGGGDDDIDTAPPATAVSGPGSVAEPYPLGTDVAVYYDDDDGVQYRWVVKVLSPVVDGAGTLAEPRQGQLADGEALAVARVRLTYESGPAPGSVSDLVFKAVGDSATVYDVSTNGCGTVAEAVALDAQLEPGQFFEGHLCWQVAAPDLASLKLAMEALPAEGRIHLILN